MTTLDNQFSSLDDAKRRNLLTMTSQLVGVAAAAVVDKGDGQALQTGASVAQSGVQYNYLNDHEMQMLDKDLQGCQAKGACDEVFKTYYALHKANEAELQATCSAGATPACKKLALDIYNATYEFQKAGYGAELTGDASKILIAFRQLNLEAQSTASGLIALPSAKAFVEALGVDAESAAGAAAAVAMASFFAGKSISDNSGKILGSNGVKTASKTIWKGEGKERIDVENPNPGQRPGKIHYQDNNGNKYIYDIDSGRFRDAPNSVNKLLNNPGFYAAVQKGVKNIWESEV